jgi:hypothetical protein
MTKNKLAKLIAIDLTDYRIMGDETNFNAACSKYVDNVEGETMKTAAETMEIFIGVGEIGEKKLGSFDLGTQHMNKVIKNMIPMFLGA